MTESKQQILEKLKLIMRKKRLAEKVLEYLKSNPNKPQKNSQGTSMNPSAKKSLENLVKLWREKQVALGLKEALKKNPQKTPKGTGEQELEKKIEGDAFFNKMAYQYQLSQQEKEAEFQKSPWLRKLKGTEKEEWEFLLKKKILADQLREARLRELEEKPPEGVIYKEAWVYFTRGNTYFKQGNIDQAVSNYNESLAIWEGNPYVYHKRGLIYLVKGDFEKAISDFNKAMELEPNFTHTQLNRGSFSVYYSRAMAYLKKGDFDQAISDFTIAIEINPNAAKTYYQRGLSYLRVGKFDHALSDFKNAILIDPRNAEFYALLGAAYAQKDNYDEAISAYKKTLEINPTHVHANIIIKDLLGIKKQMG